MQMVRVWLDRSIGHSNENITERERERERKKVGFKVIKVSKGAKIGNRYNQVPHLTQDTNGKVTNSQLDTKTVFMPNLTEHEILIMCKLLAFLHLLAE